MIPVRRAKLLGRDVEERRQRLAILEQGSQGLVVTGAILTGEGRDRRLGIGPRVSACQFYIVPGRQSRNSGMIDPVDAVSNTKRLHDPRKDKSAEYGP